MPVSEFSGVIPPAFSNQILQEATEQSAVLRLATRVPMGTSINQVPVPRGFPKAGWVKTGGRKPFTDIKLGVEQITAEEVAAVIAIPDVYVDDLSINIWAYARPLLAEAIAIALDDAVLFGIDAPDTFPAGGVAAVATNVPAGTDALETVNDTMIAVEGQGLTPSGFAADTAVRGALRGARTADGSLLMGDMQWRGSSIPSLYGLPIAYIPFTETTHDFFCGAWRYLIIGVRQDIRFDMNPAAVIADDDGKVVVSGWQDNTTPLKVWARFACGIIVPGTARRPEGAVPFSMTSLVPSGATPGSAPSPSAASARRSSGSRPAGASA